MASEENESRLFFKGVNFNISDQQKFNTAIKLLKESTNNLPLIASDNLITWNRNLSFFDDDYYKALLQGDELDAVEKSVIWRLYILIYFAEICSRLPGDFLELGCHKGATAARICERVDFPRLEKKYYLYDLFAWNEGDGHTHMPGHDNPNMYEDVVERFKGRSWVQVIKGSVPDSFSQGFPERIAFAHIDMNHPDPESAALELVLPKLSNGGFIIFDDYGWWGYRDQKLALDPIAAASGHKILELPTGQGLLFKH